MKKNLLNEYLDAVEKSLTKNIATKESWPLGPAQMIAYFDDSLSVAVFEKVRLFKKQKLGYKKAAKLFATPTIIRNFLINFAPTGLKVANNVGWFKTTFEERKQFFNYLFRILKHMVRSDIFVKDGKNTVFGRRDLKKIRPSLFIKLDTKTKKIFKSFKAALFGLVWAFYFDTFYCSGFDLHGPYTIKDPKTKESKTLVVYNYFNLRPKEIWKHSNKTPFESVRIFCIYRKLDWRMSIWGQENSSLDLNEALESVLIEVDGKRVKDIRELNRFSKTIFKIIERQTEFVSSLEPLEQVKKGAEVSYYGLRKVLSFGGGDWKPPREIDRVLKTFDEEFIKKYEDVDARKRDTRRVFDPTNNYF